MSSRAYYYVQTRQGQSVGGPYKDIRGLARGVKRLFGKGRTRDELVARKIVAGRWADLNELEFEALLGEIG